MNPDERVSSVQDKISEVRARLQALHGTERPSQSVMSVGAQDDQIRKPLFDATPNRPNTMSSSAYNTSATQFDSSPTGRARRQAPPPPQPIVVQFSPEADKIAQLQLRKIRDQNQQIAALQQQVSSMKERQEAISSARQPPEGRTVMSTSHVDFNVSRGDVHYQQAPGVSANRAPQAHPGETYRDPTPNVASLTFAEMQALLRAKLRGEPTPLAARSNPPPLLEAEDLHETQRPRFVEERPPSPPENQPHKRPVVQQPQPQVTLERQSSSHRRGTVTPPAEDLYADEGRDEQQAVYRPREAPHTSAAPSAPPPSSFQRLPPPSEDQRRQERSTMQGSEGREHREQSGFGRRTPPISSGAGGSSGGEREELFYDAPKGSSSFPRHSASPPRDSDSSITQRQRGSPPSQWASLSGAEVFAVLRLRGIITSQGVTGEHLLPTAHCHTMQLTTGEYAQLLQLRELLAASEAAKGGANGGASQERANSFRDTITHNSGHGNTPLRSKSPTFAQAAFEKHRSRMQAVREARERRSSPSTNHNNTTIN